MAEVYRFRGKTFVIREHCITQSGEAVYQLTPKTGTERLTNWRPDTMRTLGVGHGSWDSKELPVKHRDNGRVVGGMQPLSR
jgi:hypothetical protein